MSRYLVKAHQALEAYVPGEQPQGKPLIKLNTNESPYPPSPGVLAALRGVEPEKLNLYSDPDERGLRRALADYYGVGFDNVLAVNGSDEALWLAFMAFCDAENGARFPDITYGFYPVFANLFGIPYDEVPLRADFSIDPDDYIGCGRTVFIANPNAPTGLFLPLAEIERIVRGNPDHVVVVDEAYVDFGGESAMGLINQYGNLLVIQTYSKARSMAGARLGYAVGCEALIADLNRLRCSTNPYNVNRLTLAAGEQAIRDQAYYDENCRRVMKTRGETAKKLKALGFTMPDSSANFLFARHPKVPGAELFAELRARGILVRHFGKARIRDYLRVTVGTPEQMDALVDAAAQILKERGIAV